MYKEVIIIIIVISIVVCIDILSNNYTRVSVEELTNQLNELKVYILEENKMKAQAKMEEIKNKWESRYEILAYYIEHDELEKVETELVRLSADISVEEYKHCINELEATKFILEHIKQKEELNIKSIF